MNHLTSVRFEHERYPTRGHYPFSLPIFTQTRQLDFATPVTLFVGENGTGKSTLLEALAQASGIHIWSKPEGVRYQVNPYEKQLHRCLSVAWSNGSVPGSYYGSETFRDFTQILDEWAAMDPGQLRHFGGESLVSRSHGQSMMSYFRSRYQLRGIYFLDEPETALSPRSQLELLEILGEQGREGHAQFIVATHSPILLACEGARIYSFDQAPVQPIEYEETEHYQVYRRFLHDRVS